MELLAQRRDLVAQRSHLVAQRARPRRHDRRSPAVGRGRSCSRPVAHRRRSALTARPRAGACSAPPSARAGGRASGPRSRSVSRSSASSTDARSAKGCMRSVRCFSSPSVCGPRSISTQSSARSSGARPERLVEQVAVLVRSGCRGSSRGAPKPRWPSALRRLAHGRLVVVDDRIAVRRLVARQPQRVERQRIGVRSRLLLLEQAAEHPDLRRIEVVHRRPLDDDRDELVVLLLVALPLHEVVVAAPVGRGTRGRSSAGPRRPCTGASPGRGTGTRSGRCGRPCGA